MDQLVVPLYESGKTFCSKISQNCALSALLNFDCLIFSFCPMNFVTCKKVTFIMISQLKSFFFARFNSFDGSLTLVIEVAYQKKSKGHIFEATKLLLFSLFESQSWFLPSRPLEKEKKNKNKLENCWRRSCCCSGEPIFLVALNNWSEWFHERCTSYI
jgi:hypothetical protein